MTYRTARKVAETVREGGSATYGTPALVEALEELLGSSHQFADDAFAHTPDGGPLASRAEPVLLSTIKLRQAGFTGCIDTERMFEHWFAHLRRERVVP